MTLSPDGHKALICAEDSWLRAAQAGQPVLVFDVSGRTIAPQVVGAAGALLAAGITKDSSKRNVIGSGAAVAVALINEEWMPSETGTIDALREKVNKALMQHLL